MMVDDMTEPELKAGSSAGNSDGKSKRSVVSAGDHLSADVSDGSEWHRLHELHEWHDFTTNTDNTINDNLIMNSINGNEGSAVHPLHDLDGSVGSGDGEDDGRGRDLMPDPLLIDDNPQRINTIDSPLALKLADNYLKLNSDDNSVNNIIDFVVGLDDNTIFGPRLSSTNSITAQQTTTESKPTSEPNHTNNTNIDNSIHQKLDKLNEKINLLFDANLDLNNDIKSCQKYSVISVQSLSDANSGGHKRKS